MTTVDPRGVGPSGEPSTSIEAGLPADDALHADDLSARSADALRAENERLAQRVADLEMTVVEYRAQMRQVLGSFSWRLTSPLRAAASRYRHAKVRLRRALRRIRHGKAPSEGVLTAGLFPPPIDSLPEFSPLRRGFDPSALARPPAADGPLHRPPGSPRLLVVAHVHYPELWGDIEDRLSRMPEAYDLIATVTEGPAEAVTPDILRRHPKARIDVVPNRGRDWGPLVALANEGALCGYDAIAKVHTKKSEHRLDGDGWRLALLDGIFESPEAVTRIVDLLKEDRGVGLVVPTGHVASTEHWGNDRSIVEMLASRLPMAFDPTDLHFPSGSMFWCRPWLLERLADLCLTPADFEMEAGQYDATTAHALERLVGIMAVEAGMSIVEMMDVSGRLREARRTPQVRPATWAFFLPQYHRTDDNDRFWGQGFTDWDRVRVVEQLFDGHRVPLVPAGDDGYYDLATADALNAQALRARDGGLDGFLMHYYWFDGRRTLTRPLENWLENSWIDFPVALCWANESWTRRWDGLDHDVLIEQTYGPGWAQRFWDDAQPYMSDRRYLRVDGRPVLVVYRLGQVPDPSTAVSIWRASARDAGFPGLHLLAVQSSRDIDPMSPEVVELADELALFPPGSGVELHELHKAFTGLPPDLRRRILAYSGAAPSDLAEASVPVVPGVMPGWDNSARRGRRGYVFHGSNPVTWGSWLRTAQGQASRLTRPRIVVNAWNEWAEGAVLEPTRRWGDGYVRTLEDAFGTMRAPANSEAPDHWR